MVQFGRRYGAMKYPAFERLYVDYDGLKALIEKFAKPGSNHAEVSEAFMKELTKNLSALDGFVCRQLEGIAKDLAGNSSDLNKQVPSLECKVKVLSKTVGTNIIAAAKIVKKHDKRVSEKLAKRTDAANVIYSLKCIKVMSEVRLEVATEMKAVRRGDRSTTVQVELDAPTNNKSDTDEADIACGNLLLLGDTDPVGEEAYNAFLVGWSSSLHEGDIRMAQTMDKEDQEGSGWEVDFSTDDKPWSELSGGQKLWAIIWVIIRIAGVLAALYFFICSLSFLASGFRLVAGKNAGELFRNSEVFNNPIAGCLVGVLVTVLVQSSSTSTSIIITMVAAELLTVKQAIYLIMGANIGTTVTSTIVAMGQVAERDCFRRAFAAAVVHDMFNFLTVLVFLPLEAITGYLYHLSGALIAGSLTSGEKPPDILKVLTKPFTKAIVGIDKKLITKIAAADEEELDKYKDDHILKYFFGADKDDLSDGAAGALVLIFALFILCFTLFLIVWILKTLLKGRVAVWLHKSVNGNIPDAKCGSVTIPLGWMTGYLAILAGFGITICVQSSSITTSALTPLVGVGVITVERMFPVVLGANIGTCITGVLAALAADGEKLALTLRVAYAHLFFNLSGIVLWYCIWPLRVLPIRAARFLGNTTAEYRWFAIAYLIMCFFIIPAIWVGLSLAGPVPLIVVTTIVIAVAVFVVILNLLQTHKPNWLPGPLKTWHFLPVWLRSLAPYDRLMCRPLTNKCCSGKKVAPQ